MAKIEVVNEDCTIASKINDNKWQPIGFNLSNKEKEAIIDIENGFTDPYSAKGNMLGRYFEVKYEFHLAKDPNGHSLLQRFIYWETAVVRARAVS